MDYAMPRGKEQSQLLRCPRRIRDRIFHYAYAPTDPADLVALREAPKRRPRRDATPPLAEEGHSVDDFLVSKKYFNSASRSWLSSRCFDFSNDKVSPSLFHNKSIIFAHANRFKIRTAQLDYIPRLSQAQDLAIDVSVEDFFCPGSYRSPWASRFEEKELEATHMYRKFTRITAPKLKRVKLHALPFPESNLRLRHDFWTQNVKAMEQLLMKKLERDQAWRKDIFKLCQGRARLPAPEPPTTKAVQISATSSTMGIYPADEVRSTRRTSRTSSQSEHALMFDIMCGKVPSPDEEHDTRHDSAVSDGYYTQQEAVIIKDWLIGTGLLPCPVPESPNLHGAPEPADEPEIPPLALDAGSDCSSSIGYPTTSCHKVEQPPVPVRQFSAGAESLLSDGGRCTVKVFTSLEEPQEEAMGSKATGTSHVPSSQTNGSLAPAATESGEMRRGSSPAAPQEDSASSNTSTTQHTDDSNSSSLSQEELGLFHGMMAELISGGGMLAMLSLVWYVTHA